MYGNTVSATDTQEAMAYLRDAGVSTVTIEFSGGNDEGGTDSVSFFDAEGGTVEVPTSGAREETQWDEVSRKWLPVGWVVSTWKPGERWSTETRPATDEEVKLAKVLTVLEHPIYDRWGSFAGEFYVNGTLTWDVTGGTYKVTGQETVEHYEDFEYGDE